MIGLFELVQWQFRTRCKDRYLVLRNTVGTVWVAENILALACDDHFLSLKDKPTHSMPSVTLSPYPPRIFELFLCVLNFYTEENAWR